MCLSTIHACSLLKSICNQNKQNYEDCINKINKDYIVLY